MAEISNVSGPNGFHGPVSMLRWDRRGGTDFGAQINENASLRNRPTFFEANGGPVTINRTGPVVRLKVNAGMIDVNFAAAEPCLTANYPPGASLPDNTPIMLEFDAPIGSVGAYLSVLGDRSLYDGRALHAVMWVLLEEDPNWKLSFGDGVTGLHLLPDSASTSAFVGAEGLAGVRIRKVCFDASLAGNFDGLVLSRLYWAA